MKWITQAKHATQFAFIENDKKAALKEAKKEFPAQPRKQNICDSNQSEPKETHREGVSKASSVAGDETMRH